MDVAQLISTLTVQIGDELYGPTKYLRFIKDRRAIMKAIARYGYECEQRGWKFEPEFIFKDIKSVIATIKPSEVRTWLPVYLESAIDRHIRIRAEELSAKAKALDNTVAKAINKTKDLPVKQPANSVRLLADLYADLKRARKRKPTKKPPKQKELF